MWGALELHLQEDAHQHFSNKTFQFEISLFSENQSVMGKKKKREVRNKCLSPSLFMGFYTGD